MADWCLHDKDSFYGGISKKGMDDELKYVGFNEEQVEYAIENCGVDWYEQALGSANKFLGAWDGSEDETQKEDFKSGDHYNTLVFVLEDECSYTSEESSKAAKEAIENYGGYSWKVE